MNNLKNARILIVDDTPENIQVLGIILENAGYDINVAQNGLKALNIVEKINPDLILLDIMMPELDGFETCKRLKESSTTKDIPVIFLTAKTQKEDIVNGFKIGAVDYVTKPFEPSELLQRVNTHINLKKSNELIVQQNNERKELIQIMCHDLANPLGFLIGVLDLAEDDPSIFEEMKDYMRIATENGIRIINLVREMKALEEGKATFTLQDVHLKSAVDQTISIMKYQLQDKNIIIESNIDENEYVKVEETSFINSVLSNIMTNAIKFSDPNSKIIINSKKKGQKIILSIKDSGIGMPQNLIENIFNMNKPTSRPGTKGEKGTGFGMPLVKKFVEVYDGQIEIISKEKSKDSIDYGTDIQLTLNGTDKSI